MRIVFKKPNKQQMSILFSIALLLSTPLRAENCRGGECSGGGNTYKGKLIENHQCTQKIKSTQAYKEFEKEIDKLKTSLPELASEIANNMSKLSVYCLPGKLKDLSVKTTGLFFKTSQDAVQSLSAKTGNDSRELYINADYLNKNQTNTKELKKFFIHEGLVSFLLNQQKIGTDSIDKMNVRGVTNIIADNQYSSTEDLLKKLDENHFITKNPMIYQMRFFVNQQELERDGDGYIFPVLQKGDILEVKAKIWNPTNIKYERNWVMRVSGKDDTVRSLPLKVNNSSESTSAIYQFNKKDMGDIKHLGGLLTIRDPNVENRLYGEKSSNYFNAYLKTNPPTFCTKLGNSLVWGRYVFKDGKQLYGNIEEHYFREGETVLVKIQTKADCPNIKNSYTIIADSIVVGENEYSHTFKKDDKSIDVAAAYLTSLYDEKNHLIDTKKVTDRFRLLFVKTPATEANTDKQEINSSPK